MSCVAVGPRFPIGYKCTRCSASVSAVAVGPRFPIGYKEHIEAVVEADGCGWPAFPHRL